MVLRSKRRSTAVQNFCPIKNSLRSEEDDLKKKKANIFFQKKMGRKFFVFYIEILKKIEDFREKKRKNRKIKKKRKNR